MSTASGSGGSELHHSDTKANGYADIMASILDQVAPGTLETRWWTNGRLHGCLEECRARVVSDPHNAPVHATFVRFFEALLGSTSVSNTGTGMGESTGAGMCESLGAGAGAGADTGADADADADMDCSDVEDDSDGSDDSSDPSAAEIPSFRQAWLGVCGVALKPAEYVDRPGYVAVTSKKLRAELDRLGDAKLSFAYAREFMRALIRNARSFPTCAAETLGALRVARAAVDVADIAALDAYLVKKNDAIEIIVQLMRERSGAMDAAMNAHACALLSPWCHNDEYRAIATRAGTLNLALALLYVRECRDDAFVLMETLAKYAAQDLVNLVNGASGATSGASIDAANLARCCDAAIAANVASVANGAKSAANGARCGRV